MSQIISTVVIQHAEEAASLWTLRCYAGGAPQFRIFDIARLDERIEAHVDGLRIACEPGWKLCKAALGNEESGEVFVASIIAYESGIESRIQTVLDAVEKNAEITKALVSGLGWIPFQQVAPHIQRLLTAESSQQKGIGLAASAAHRQDPCAALNDALNSIDLLLKARALKSVGELGRKDLLPFLRTNLTEQDTACRFWAAWSGALLGEPAAIQVLQRFAETGDARAGKACATALRRMPLDQAKDWQRHLACSTSRLRMAVQAMGVIGDPANIPWLIQQMADPVLARVAGESFTFITGIDLAYDDLDTDKPEGFEAGPTENPEDENVDMDPDEDLPWPNLQLIEKWWFTHRVLFTNGTRYLCGQPMTIESLNQVLRTGKQRQRIAAAIELAMRQSGQPLFNTSAPGFRQQALLGLQ